MKKYILLILITILATALKAQISEGGYPYTYADSKWNLFESMRLKSGSEKGNFVLPFVNNDNERAYAKSIKENCSSCKNDLYAKGLQTNINFKTQAEKVVSENGLNVWILRFQSSQAYGMQFFFSDFKLPRGAKLYFYNEDRTFLLGAFTNANNAPDRKFTTQFIQGSTIYMEYIETTNPEFEGSLVISNVAHVFRNVFDKANWPPVNDGDRADACHIDAICHSYDWDKEIRTVAVILIPYTDVNDQIQYMGQCSGALINKVNNYKDTDNPYFLTANHCLYLEQEDGTSLYIGDDVGKWVFMFNYQNSVCGLETMDPADADLDELMKQSATGAQIISRDVNRNISDFCLLKLTGNNTVGNMKKYGACYAGWEKHSNNIQSSTQFIGIHHPRTDFKKISFCNGDVYSSSYSDNNGPTNYWKLSWDLGVTEPGSSGSPLFNDQHRIVGHLRGGTSFCEDTYDKDGNYMGGPHSHDYYGKFSTSFEVGNFYQFLDPYNNNDYVNTFEPAGSTPPDPYCNFNGVCEHNLGENPVNCPNDCPRSCTTNIKDGFWIQRNLDELIYECNNYPDLLLRNDETCGLKLPWVDVTRKCGLFNLFTCYDVKSEFYVSIADCDENLNSTNPVGKWFNKDIGGGAGTGYINLSEVGKELRPGNYYAVKLAGNYSDGYQEYTRYIYILPTLKDMTLTGGGVVAKIASILKPDYAVKNTITVKDITIANNLKLAAGKEITMLPGTNIQNVTNFSAEINELFYTSCNSLTKSNEVDAENKLTKSEVTMPVTMNKNKFDKQVDIVEDKIDQNQIGIYVYPNPSTSVLNFRIGSDEQINSIHIINSLGILIKEIECIDTEMSIDISSFQNGTYFVQFLSNNGTTLRRFVKQ